MKDLSCAYKVHSLCLNRLLLDFFNHMCWSVHSKCVCMIVVVYPAFCQRCESLFASVHNKGREGCERGKNGLVNGRGVSGHARPHCAILYHA